MDTPSPLSKRYAPSPLQIVVMGVLGVLVLVVSALLIGTDQVRIAVAVSFLVPMLALATVNLRAAIIAMLVYLVIMGDLRRMLVPIAGWSGQDPLLLLNAVLATLFCGWAVLSRAIKLDTPLARWMMVFMAIAALQIFNPKQGGLIVGVVGAMFFFVPLFWFWIGRAYATPAFMRTVLFKVLLPLAVLAAAMGLYQSFYGYLPYQMAWYNVAGYVALGPPGSLAPISLFASSTEYGNFLISAIAILWAATLRKHRVALLLIIPLFVAVFLAGSRGPVVKVLFTCVILWAVMGHTVTQTLKRGLLALLIGVVGLGWVLTQATELETNARIQHRLDRQAEGLLPGQIPEGETSTTDIHLEMMLDGYAYALKEPMGLGIGATTKAADKFAEDRSVSTEVDTTNVLVATGLIGGLIYHIMIVVIIALSIRYWTQTRSMLALALMGVLAVNFLLWMSGQYAMSAIVWLCIGALDRLHRDATRRAEEAEMEEAEAQSAAVNQKRAALPA